METESSVINELLCFYFIRFIILFSISVLIVYFVIANNILVIIISAA